MTGRKPISLSSIIVVLLLFQELKSQLDTCLSDGTPLLVTDCNMDIILTDKRFLAVLASRSRFISSNMPFKLMVCAYSFLTCTFCNFEGCLNHPFTMVPVFYYIIWDSVIF